jgi:hypothetical protein
MRLAQAASLLAGEPFVTPDTIRRVAPAALAHRLVLHSRRRTGGSAAEVVAEVLDQVPVPTKAYSGGPTAVPAAARLRPSGSGAPGTARHDPGPREG